MISYAFKRTSATYRHDGTVKLSESGALEIIDVASDWRKGETLRGAGKHWETGYIGSGFTKIGVYARYNDKEYVLTTLSRDNPDVQDALRAEYQLLCIGDALKSIFEEYAEARGVQLPPFYFNFKDSILGELVLDDGTACVLPHPYFIATPLLPCGKDDGLVKKFTGSDAPGDAPDRLTQAIHAFAHFGLIYNENRMLLCDLQGLSDADGVLCLFDPECHTDTGTFDRMAFWDCGPRPIHRFLNQHVSSGKCEENYACKVLRLATASTARIRRSLFLNKSKLPSYSKLRSETGSQGIRF